MVYETGQRLKLRYRLRSEQTEYVEDAHWHAPMEIVIGQSDLPDWLVLALQGGHETLQLTADQVREFAGDHEEGKVMMMPRSEFGDEFELKAGQIMGFSTPTGTEIAGRIDDFNEDFVAIDFNHPFAGAEVILELKIE